jgi:hypothetical protein
LWKSKLSKCSFVIAAISAVGFGIALVPFVAGPPPHLSGLKINMRHEHHRRSDNHMDHANYQDHNWGHDENSKDENSNGMPLTKNVVLVEK